jgi:PIN domain nuclease of toxin-antitoxin system
MNLTSKYVIDSWAWIEYFDATKYGLKAKGIIEKHEIFTSAITISELVSKFLKEGKDPNEMVSALVSLSKIINIDINLARGIGMVHYQVKRTNPNFSFGDAAVLYTARSLNAKVLTGDPDFEGIKEVEMLK